MEEDTDNPVTFDAHAKTINAAVSAVLIYKARSTRLATRLIKVIDHIPKKSSASDLHITTNINLLSVTKDDILAYYKLISETSPELVSHLLKYGSDEECFYKWNERLRLISIIFNVPGISTVFDTKVDRQDLRDDVVHLHENTGFVTKVTAEKDGIKALLSNQETKAYKTVQNVDIGIVIKAKMIRYDRVLGKDEAKAKLKVEAEVMRSLSHPGIVACIGVVDEGTDFCMIMELSTGGSLDDLIKTRKDLSLRIKLDLALDIANGMSYLHRLHVVHRDLKPGNIVLDDSMRPKITDFGLAFTQSASMTSFRGTEMGTPAFMAPECFGLTPVFSTRSDVYAFSIVLWELIHLQHAYMGVNALEIRDSIREGSRLGIAKDTLEEVSFLITQCWDQNPRTRPTFSEVVVYLKLIVSTNETIIAEPPSRLFAVMNPTFVNVPKSTDSRAGYSDVPTNELLKKIPKKKNWKQFILKRKICLAAICIVVLIGLSGGIFAIVISTSSKAQDSSVSSTDTPTSGIPATILSNIPSVTVGSINNNSSTYDSSTGMSLATSLPPVSTWTDSVGYDNSSTNSVMSTLITLVATASTSTEATIETSTLASTLAISTSTSDSSAQSSSALADSVSTSESTMLSSTVANSAWTSASQVLSSSIPILATPTNELAVLFSSTLADSASTSDSDVLSSTLDTSASTSESLIPPASTLLDSETTSESVMLSSTVADPASSSESVIPPASTFDSSSIILDTSSDSSPSTTVPLTTTTSTMTTTTSTPRRTSIPISPSSIITVKTIAQDNTRLERVWGITVDDDELVYTASSTGGSGSIYRVASDGGLTLIYTYKADNLGRWFLIIFDCRSVDQGLCHYNGSLYLPRMSKIIKIDVKSPYVTSVFVGTTVAPNDTRTDGPYNVATFAAAVYCSFDNDGNMYVTDSTSTTGYLVPSFIRKVDREGNVTTVLTSTDIKFQSVEVDNTGQLILASYGSRYIYRRFNNTAVTSLEFFDNPNAVVSDLFGNLFVVDTGAHSLYWIDTQNTVRLLAGTPSTPGYKDQNSTTGPIALFNNPRCIAFDSKGVLYLVEQSNRAVRQITWTS